MFRKLTLATAVLSPADDIENVLMRLVDAEVLVVLLIGSGYPHFFLV